MAHVVDLLCTSPRDPVLKGLPPTGARDYLSTVLRLFEGANSGVDVVCPFIDRDGVKQLRAWASHTRAQLSVYTRAAVPELLAAADELGWTVYSYQGTLGEDERRGFHCKFFLADEASAVLGSVNLVYHNMLENLELGFYTEDPRHAAALRDVVSTLRAASRLVAPLATRRLP